MSSNEAPTSTATDTSTGVSDLKLEVVVIPCR